MEPLYYLYPGVAVMDIHTFDFPDRDPITIRTLYLEFLDESSNDSEDVWGSEDGSDANKGSFVVDNDDYERSCVKQVRKLRHRR